MKEANPTTLLNTENEKQNTKPHWGKEGFEQQVTYLLKNVLQPENQTKYH